MRLARGIAALAAASMSSAAVAETAAQAFECTLPYRASMEAIAKLTVTGQSSDKGFAVMLGPSTTLEFAADSTRIYGQSPTKLSLTMREPAPNDREKIYTMTFQSVFPRDRAVDRAIIGSNAWHLNACGDGLPLCQRANEPDGGAKLRYYRDDDWNDDDERDLKLECEFKIREEDVEQ